MNVGAGELVSRDPSVYEAGANLQLSFQHGKEFGCGLEASSSSRSCDLCSCAVLGPPLHGDVRGRCPSLNAHLSLAAVAAGLSGSVRGP